MVDAFKFKLLIFTVSLGCVFSQIHLTYRFFSRSPFFYATVERSDRFSTQLRKLSSSHFLQFKVRVSGLINSVF